MKRHTPAFFLTATLAAALAPGCAPSEQASVPEAAEAPPAAPEVTLEEALAEVGALMERQAEDWNSGDFEAFCSVYADDAAFASPSGLTFGRQAVLERYQRRYPDAEARGQLSFEVIDGRLAEGGDALSLMARWKLAREGAEDAEGLTLIVLHRQDGGWRIVQDASM